MPILLLVILLVPLLAGCVPGGARSDGIPSPDAPFILTALDVGQSTCPFRCLAQGVGGALHAESAAQCRTSAGAGA
jgi:hypothetical protein